MLIQKHLKTLQLFFIIELFCALIGFQCNAQAKQISKNQLLLQHGKQLNLVNQEILSSGNYIVHFHQTNIRNEISTGIIYVQKPDRVLIDYQEGKIKSKVLVKEGEMVYYDKILEKTSIVKRKSDVLFNVLVRGIDFNKFKITKIEENDNAFIVFFHAMGSDVAFSFLKDKNYRLHSMTTFDKQKRMRAKVVVNEYQKVQNIDKKIFILPLNKNKK